MTVFELFTLAVLVFNLLIYWFSVVISFFFNKGIKFVNGMNSTNVYDNV